MTASDEQRLMQFVYQIPVGVAELHPDGELGMANPTAVQLILQIAPGSLNLFRLLSGFAPEVELLVAEYKADRGTILEDYRVDFGRRAPNAPHPLVVSFTVKKLGPSTMMVAMTDVSASVAAERAARSSHQMLRVMNDAIRDYGVFRLDADGVVTEWTASAARVFGRDAGAATGLGLAELSRSGAIDARKALSLVAESGWTTLEAWWRRGDGTSFWGSAATAAIHDRDGAIEAYVCVVRQQTATVGAGDDHPREDVDPELGCLTRSAFDRVARRVFEAHHDQGAPLAVALVELDGLAEREETLGDGVTALLRACLHTLRDHVEGEDAVIRFSPGRFLLLLPGVDLPAGKARLERVRSAMEQRIVDTEAALLKLTVSAGVTAVGSAESDPLGAIGRAEAAVDAARARGGNQVVIGHPGTQGRAAG